MSTFTKASWHTARKPHWCSVCCRKIEPGEVYKTQRGFEAGDAWTFKNCSHCEAVTQIYDPRDCNDLISERGFIGWLDNGPRDWDEAKAMAGWRMQWRTRGGRLLPVPEVTP